jgi:hypothetical protein
VGKCWRSLSSSRASPMDGSHFAILGCLDDGRGWDCWWGCKGTLS